MTAVYDWVFSEDPAIIITEDDDGTYTIYVEGEFAAHVWGSQQAKETAQEIFDSVVGEDLHEEDYDDPVYE